MSRKKGEGEGSLKKAGDVWKGRWVQWIGDQQKRPKTSFPVVKFPTKREARDELNRIYIRAVFEFAVDEGIIQRNPAKRLELPPTRKVCERYLSMEEVHALIGAAAGREKLVLRVFLVAGLRPAELFALKTDDIMPGELRIDEAIKEREKQATGCAPSLALILHSRCAYTCVSRFPIKSGISAMWFSAA